MGNAKTGIDPCCDSVCKVERLSRLLDLISSGGEAKQEAELAIKQLEVTDEYPVHLTAIILNPNRPTNVRIFAAEKLEKFVTYHWCATDHFFLPPEISLANKTEIKELLISRLQEPIVEVRTAVADVISTIAHSDLPDNWPGLTDTLVSCLNGGCESSLHGALLVFDKLDIRQTDGQSRDLVVMILRKMNQIFDGENQYSEQVRGLACGTFAETVAATVQQEKPDMIQRYVRPEVRIFYENLTHNWVSKNCSNQLRIGILNALTRWVEYIPKYVRNFLDDMLPLVWETLIVCAKDYQSVVNGGDRCEKAMKTGNYPVGLINAVFELIGQLFYTNNNFTMRHPDNNLLEDEWFHIHVSLSAPRTLRHLIMLVEVTEEQIERWKTDYNEFVEQEDFDDCSRDGIRRTAIEVILDAKRQNKTIANGLTVVIMKYLEEENERRINGQSGVGLSSWKSHEAFLLAFSLMKDCIAPKKNRSLPHYDVVPILENIVLADLNDSASHPLLVGRCLSLGGIYSENMPINIASAFLDATVNGLEENQPTCIKICAANAVYLWYTSSNDSKIQDQNMLLSRVPALFEGLFTLAENFKSTEVYTLIVQGISSLIPFDKAYTASVATRIYYLAEKALLEYHILHLTDTWKTIVTELMLHTECIQLLETHLTQGVLGLITTPPNQRSCGSEALEIVQILANHSVLPQSNFLTDTLFPAACNYIVTTTDRWIVYFRGIRFMETYLSLTAQRVIHYQGTKARYGAQYILQVIVHALKLQSFATEDDSEKICQILILLMTKYWHEMREGMDDLLRTLLDHTQKEEFALVLPKLLMVYAHLMHRGSSTVFNFLASTLDFKEQKNFLNSVIADGFCKEYHSVNAEQREIIKLALGKVLEHGVAHPSSPLHQITVRDFKQQILLLVKICRLTINDQSSDKRTDDQWVHYILN